MVKSSSLTIIDDKNMRGVIAPAKAISRKLLEDIIDLIEWSHPSAISETEILIREADRKKSWISAKEVEKRLKGRIKAAK